jgi:hypothetical protein
MTGNTIFHYGLRRAVGTNLFPFVRLLNRLMGSVSRNTYEHAVSPCG